MNDSTFPDVLREYRNRPSTAYLEFLRTLGKKTLHVFVEGDGDSSFYRNFLQPYAPSFDQCHFHDCRGKPKVYQTREMIRNKRDRPDWSHTMVLLYFVDKDLSDILEDDYPVASDVFVTDYYSVENYLVSEEMLRIVLEDIFNFHGNHRPMLEPICQNFNRELGRFYEYARTIMAWGIYHKLDRSGIEFEDIKIRRLIDIRVRDGQLKLVRKVQDQSRDLYETLDNMCGVETSVTRGELENEVNSLLKGQHPKAYIRGKFEVEFFLMFLEALRDYFTRRNVSVKVRHGLLGRNVIVHTLGPKVSPPPQSLSTFLDRNLSAGTDPG